MNAPAGPGPGRGLLAALAGITVLAALLRLVLLGRQSFWLDEAFSVAFVRQPWGEFWHTLTTREANMALYHGLLRQWVGLGDAEWTVRAFSVVPSVATVPVLYALGARLLGRRTALLAAGLLALHSSHIRYAQEARGYSLAVFLVTLSSLLFVAAVRKPSPGRWAVYSVTAALAVYAHFFAALVLVAQWLSPALLPGSWQGSRRGGEPRRTSWRGVVGSAAAIVLLALPLGFFVVMGDQGQIGWVRPPGPEDIGVVLWALSGTGGEVAAYAGLAGLALAAWWKALRRDGRSDEAWRHGLLAGWLLLPILLALGVSLVKPMFVDRYLLVCLPAFVLLAADGVSRVRPARRRGVVLAAILCLALSGFAIHHAEFAKEDWRGVTRHILAQARPDDAAIFYPAYVRRPYDYYRTRLGHPAAGPEIVFPPGDYSRETPDGALLARLPQRYRRVWVVLSHIGYSGRDPFVVDRLIGDTLEREYGPAHAERFTKIRVLLYGSD